MTPVTGLHGSLAVCRTLEALGVRHVFGLPGTQNTAFYEALRQVGFSTVVPTHELSAAFMAGAYYRASGIPGVLTTIPGPGLAYALAGLAEARLDSAAVLYLINAPRTDTTIGFSLQALDQRALLAPVTKAILSVTDVNHIDSAVREAWQLAMSGEPGPVVLELGEKTEGPQVPGSLQSPAASDLLPTPAEIDDAWRLIQSSKKPVLLVGQGGNGAADEIRALAQRLSAPVLTTPSARGVVAESSQLAMGFDVLKSAMRAVNALLGEADRIIVLGAKLGHNGSAGFGLALPPDKLIRVDTSARSLEAVYPASRALRMDVGDFLSHSQAEACAPSSWTALEIAAHRSAIRALSVLAEPRIAHASPADFYGALRRALPAETCLVTDTGMHQVTARRHYEVLHPRSLLMPSDFQSMGFGLPAAIAARLANPSRPVVAFVGDGGFRMTGFDLAIAVRDKIPLTVLLLNDASLNQIRLQQLSEFGSASATELGEVDFEDFAASVGAAFEFAASPQNLQACLAKSIASPGVTLIEVPVGDSASIKVGAAKARVKRIARRAIGGSLLRRRR